MQILCLDSCTQASSSSLRFSKQKNAYGYCFDKNWLSEMTIFSTVDLFFYSMISVVLIISLSYVPSVHGPN